METPNFIRRVNKTEPSTNVSFSLAGEVVGHKCRKRNWKNCLIRHRHVMPNSWLCKRGRQSSQKLREKNGREGGRKGGRQRKSKEEANVTSNLPPLLSPLKMKRKWFVSPSVVQPTKKKQQPNPAMILVGVLFMLLSISLDYYGLPHRKYQ